MIFCLGFLGVGVWVRVSFVVSSLGVYGLRYLFFYFVLIFRGADGGGSGSGEFVILRFFFGWL